MEDPKEVPGFWLLFQVHGQKAGSEVEQTRLESVSIWNAGLPFGDLAYYMVPVPISLRVRYSKFYLFTN